MPTAAYEFRFAGEEFDCQRTHPRSQASDLRNTPVVVLGPEMEAGGLVRALARVTLCRRGDLNPYALCGHQALNLARLPIPPLRLGGKPLYRPEPTLTLEASNVPRPERTRPVTRAEATDWNWNWARGTIGIWSRTSFSAAW